MTDHSHDHHHHHHGHDHSHINEEIIRLRDVRVRYGTIEALSGVTADVHCGSLTAIVGPNGAGKSTLLRAVLGWQELDAGSITLGDDHISHHRPRLAYVPQRTVVDWDFPVTVRMVVEQARFATLGRWKPFRREDHELVELALEEMDLTRLATRQIGELSGGEQQRMVLARALAQGGDIFLLDEPFKGLDAAATEQLLHRIEQWRDMGRTVVAVVHDLGIVRRLFTRVLLLDRSILAEGSPSDVMTPERLRKAYGDSIARLYGEEPAVG